MKLSYHYYIFVTCFLATLIVNRLQADAHINTSFNELHHMVLVFRFWKKRHGKETLKERIKEKSIQSLKGNALIVKTTFGN